MTSQAPYITPPHRLQWDFTGYAATISNNDGLVIGRIIPRGSATRERWYAEPAGREERPYGFDTADGAIRELFRVAEAHREWAPGEQVERTVKCRGCGLIATEVMVEGSWICGRCETPNQEVR